MSIFVILLILGLIFIIFIVGVIMLVMRMPGRHRGKQKLLTVDNVGNLLFLGLSRRKWIQPHGTGFEAFPYGLGKKPLALTGQNYEVPFANCTLNVNQTFLDVIDSHFMRRYHEERYENQRLESELSSIKADLFKLQSESNRVVDKKVDDTINYVKKIMPMINMKKPGSSSRGA